MKPNGLLGFSVAILITFLLQISVSFSQKAFPDAIGFGAKCKGAYAGSSTPAILIVDTLCSASVGSDLTKRGSLRWALGRNYPRIIIFEVSGYIDLESAITINNPYVTIAGQTAPSPGITIRYYTLRINTHDAIVQHLRFRLGNNTIDKGSFDAMAIYGGPNTYVDHCSFSWGVDENFSLSSTDNIGNVTISNCIISEALYDNLYDDHPNGYGMLIRNGDSITLVNNLFAHLADRAPLVANTARNVVISNNLLYNTGAPYCNIYLGETIEPYDCSVIGNCMIPGNDTKIKQIIRVVEELKAGSRIYLEDNEGPGRTEDPWSVVIGSDKVSFRVNTPAIWDNSFNPLPSTSLETYLLPKVGARPLDRDEVDQRIINDVINRTGNRIDSQDEVGGFPELEKNKVKLDIPEDPHKDDDANGYTNIEEWIYQYHLKLIDESISQNNKPQIDNQSFTVSENCTNGHFIGEIKASDPDSTSIGSFRIISGNETGVFELDVSTGSLFVKDNTYLDYETMKSHDLLISVFDIADNTLYDNATITINVLNVNEKPVVEDQVFNTDVLANGNIGKVVATDPDNNQLIFSINENLSQGMFSINSVTGEISTYGLGQFARDTVFRFTVIVKDNGEPALENSAKISIYCKVSDIICYIDPENKNDLFEDGSVYHPYDSWEDVKWIDGVKYFQRANTTAFEEKINILASNVMLSSYGEGERPIIISDTKDFTLKVMEKSCVKISNLHIIAKEAISCAYILGTDVDSIYFENCIFEGAGNGVRMIGGKNLFINYSTFVSTSEAIYSFAENTEIYYNIFKHNYTGIDISSSLSTARIYNNVFYDNRRGVATSYSDLITYNNIYHLNNAGDIAISHKMDKLISDNNIYYPEQPGFIELNNVKIYSLEELQSSHQIDNHSITEDPLFEDINNEIFNLSYKSPGIDAGKDVGLQFDFFGYKVPNGNAPDIGIYEAIETNNYPAGYIDTIEEEFAIYPNPSNGHFNINLNAESSDDIYYRIIDTSGRLVFANYIQSDGNSTFELDLSESLNNGFYYLLLHVGNKIYSGVFVKY